MNEPPADGFVLEPVSLSVGMARRWVGTQLEGRPDGVVQTAQLLVSELATNAVLHAQTPFRVRVRDTRGARIRIEVYDGSTELPSPREYATDATTGRGLKLVEALSGAWGIELGPSGKVVFFELDETHADAPSDESASLATIDVDLSDWPDLEDSTATAPSAQPADPPGDLTTFTIIGVPLALMHRSTEQYEALEREFRLILDQEPSARAEVPGRLLSLIEELIARFGSFNPGVDRDIEDARRRGDASIDLTYRLPAAAGEAAARYDVLLDEADAYCRAGKQLLTLAAPAETLAFRKWFLLEFVRQAAGDAPLPWPDSPWAAGLA